MLLFTFATCQEKLAALPKKRDRKTGRKAFKYLTEDAQESSAYIDFVIRHLEFLKRHRAPTAQQRKLPLRFLEEQGLECCLWPHLYWRKELCETVVRATDERRKRGQARDSSSSEEASSLSGGEDHGPKLKSGRHSIKKSFLTKVLSPVIGYSEAYDLLHFVYDLSMWSTLGATKNSARGIPLRLALQGASFSPEYWRIRHLAVLDLQKQVGLPYLFRTRAPYERSFPYHQWVLDEMAKTGRGRQELPGPETLHMAHVLKELDRGYFTGFNKQTQRADRRWRHHLLGPAEGSAEKTVKTFVSRLEFQDGKRKTGTQRYHGRGTTHSHSLDFLTNVKDIGLEHKISASVPAKDVDPYTRGIVLDSQLDRRTSGLPVQEEATYWSDEAGKPMLYHTEEDHDLHVRAYFPEALQVTKCHEDVLHSDGKGALLRYVATYQSKFSGGFAGEWLNDDASDYSVARRVLCDHHPLEPEMWLHLAGRHFPQFSMGGSLQPIVAPYPGMKEKPKFVEQYEAGNMFVLFLR